MKDFLRLITPFFYGTEKSYARWAGLFLMFLTQSTIAFGYFFVQWNKRFFDALESKDSSRFFEESLVFLGLALAIVLINSMSRYYGQKYAFRWRIWMTQNALTTWLHDPKRGELEGSDQRIQEDLMRFTTIFERFFLDGLNSLLLIIMLIPLLFATASSLTVGNFNLAWTILFVAVGYTLLGILVSAKIANPLIQLEYDNQRLEAELRYNLVHVRDGAQKTSGFFDVILGKLQGNYYKTYNRQKYFNVWQKFYDQLSFMIPFVLLASNYLNGLITLGVLMQIKSIFSRIRNAMAYLLDHYAELTEMLAISKRLVEFYHAANITFPHQVTLDDDLAKQIKPNFNF
jgi:ABC-type long-subunit fatty acid transport system fused permease/ATPase subunit